MNLVSLLSFQLSENIIPHSCKKGLKKPKKAPDHGVDRDRS